MTAVRRFFLDTEFIEDGRTIELISIGIVCDDGREYYAESCEVPWGKADPWVHENVRPHLVSGDAEKPLIMIAREIVGFVAARDAIPEFWGYYCDYDWVLLCRLYGRMLDLPWHWPMLCLDVKQEAIRLGNPKLPAQSEAEHHALHDARWIRDAWLYLEGLGHVESPAPR